MEDASLMSVKDWMESKIERELDKVHVGNKTGEQYLMIE